MAPPRRIPRRHVVVGLGANLGDRRATLRAAVDALAEVPENSVLGRSGLYETPPAGGPPQPDYLNGAVLLATELSLAALMRLVLEVEQRLGRKRPDPVRWGPRTIDLDLLWCSEEVSHDPHATVPHPRLRERAFALRPLLDVAPEAVDASTGERFIDVADALPEAGQLRRVGDL